MHHIFTLRLGTLITRVTIIFQRALSQLRVSKFSCPVRRSQLRAHMDQQRARLKQSMFVIDRLTVFVEQFTHPGSVRLSNGQANNEIKIRMESTGTALRHLHTSLPLVQSMQLDPCFLSGQLTHIGLRLLNTAVTSREL